MFSRLLDIRQIFVYLLIAFYILLLSVGLMREDKLFLAVTAVMPFAAGLIYLLFFHLKRFAFLIILIIPLSVNLRDIGAGIGLSLPAEIMIVCLAFIFILSFFFGNTRFQPFLKHPVSLVIFASLFWNIFTTLTSTMPAISIKFVFIRFLFVTVFYFFFLEIFNNNENIKKYLNLYTVSLLAVIIYALINLWKSRIFNDYYYISQPFYVDHTIYSACIAMLIPITIIRLLKNRFFSADLFSGRFIAAMVLIIILAGFIFSYSRAAWLSLFAAAAFFAWLQFKLSFKLLLVVLLVGCLIFLQFQGQMLDNFSRNKKVSQAGMIEHAQSVTNVSTDVSNKERINRWKCAIRMFEDKPVFGFGPGTYQFQYAPYQKPSELTRMSTFNGDRGESHSEYLKPLSESGLPGFIFQVILVLAAIQTGMRVVYRSRNRETKLLATAILLGLCTYFVHGFVNFYQDTDKAACLYWGMMAMLVAMDMNIKNKIEDTSKSMISLLITE